MTVLLVLLVATLTSGLPAWALTRDVWLSTGAALLLFGLFAAVSGLLASVLGAPVLVVFVPLAVAANAVAAYALVRGRAKGAGSQPLAGAVVAATTAVGLLPLKAPGLGWDTRTHWLGPARWYYGGGHYVHYALTSPAFHHRTYPPLLAASAGTLWRFQGHIDLRSGQVLISLMNFGAILLLGLAIPRLFPKKGALPTLGAVLLVLAAFGVAGSNTTNGYADLLWAASATAAVAYLLLAPVDRVNVGVGALLVGVAGMTKVEGTAVALLLAVLAVLRHRRRLGRMLPVLGAGAVVILWPLYVRFLGLSNEIHGKDVRSFVGLRAGTWRRVEPTFRSMDHAVGGVLVVALVCAVLGWATARSARERARIGSSLWVWVVVLLATGVIAAAYVVASDQLALHLSASVDRVTIVLRLLLMLDLTIWGLCAVRSLANRSRRDPVAARPSAVEAVPASSDAEAVAVPG